MHMYVITLCGCAYIAVSVVGGLVCVLMWCVIVKVMHIWQHYIVLCYMVLVCIGPYVVVWCCIAMYCVACSCVCMCGVVA